MQKQYPLKVIFRRFKESGELLVMFPELVDSTTYTITVYTHAKGYGQMFHRDIRNQTVLVKKGEYEGLLTEVASIRKERLYVCQRNQPVWY